MAGQRGSFSSVHLPSTTILLSLTVLAIVIGSSSAASVFSHPLSKRSFFDINCHGFYDKSIFARLDRYCQDCSSLYREPELHGLCRGDCFTSKYFKGCLDALLVSDEESIQNIMKDISIIHQVPI